MTTYPIVLRGHKRPIEILAPDRVKVGCEAHHPSWFLTNEAVRAARSDGWTTYLITRAESAIEGLMDAGVLERELQVKAFTVGVGRGEFNQGWMGAEDADERYWNNGIHDYGIIVTVHGFDTPKDHPQTSVLVLLQDIAAAVREDWDAILGTEPECGWELDWHTPHVGVHKHTHYREWVCRCGKKDECPALLALGTSNHQ